VHAPHTEVEEGMTHIPIIAIVDDDESVREAIANLLRSSGFTAEAFESATSFLQAASLAHTACLILDMQMPGMTGIELQKHLLREGLHIPIIFISDFREEKIKAKAFKAGAIDFLQKPFGEEALLRGIQTALNSGDSLAQRSA
jgi:FixJ family two-component response regulator